jgi:hypothetical protein
MGRFCSKVMNKPGFFCVSVFGRAFFKTIREPELLGAAGRSSTEGDCPAAFFHPAAGFC